jgi:hypothetical protein
MLLAKIVVVVVVVDVYLHYVNGVRIGAIGIYSEIVQFFLRRYTVYYARTVRYAFRFLLWNAGFCSECVPSDYTFIIDLEMHSGFCSR